MNKTCFSNCLGYACLNHLNVGCSGILVRILGKEVGIQVGFVNGFKSQEEFGNGFQNGPLATLACVHPQTKNKCSVHSAKAESCCERNQDISQYIFLKLLPNSQTWMKYLRVNATCELIKSKPACYRQA